MTTNANAAAGANSLLALIDEYAEARHSKGHSSYNAEVAGLRQRIDAALSAAAEPPAGWRMVPVEPTIGMCIAGDEARITVNDSTRTPAVYRAMIAAAPKAVQSERVPLTEAQLKQIHHIEEFGLFCDYSEFEQIARAIELAHGIKPKEQSND